MKTKKLKKKLVLHKETVVDLNKTHMNDVKGGRTDTCPEFCTNTCVATICGNTCEYTCDDPTCAGNTCDPTCAVTCAYAFKCIP